VTPSAGDPRRARRIAIAAALLCVGLPARSATLVETAALALVHRVVPGHAAEIRVEQVPPGEGGSDVFEVETTGGRLVLRGNTGVSIASALNWYLGNVAHAQTSWDGDNLALPSTLPAVPSKVRITSPYARRAYLNYCTFNYTMSWWDRARWEREIDWMALHGINMPLATTGQEAVMQATLRRFGMEDAEIRTYLAGPAFSCWQLLTNIEQWAGPLPQSWIDSHLALGRFILDRERALGMTPILQGFSGCVPMAFREKFPGARIQLKQVWCAVPPGTAQLDPDDPLFARFGREFLEQQARLLGTDHLYAADPFHESGPPKDTPDYLAAVGAKLFSIASDFDPRAIIVMQGWTIREGIVKGIPADRLLVLDLTGEKWRETQTFWGRPWVVGVLHNFGGRTSTGANLPAIAANAPALLSKPEGGRLVGLGVFPEAIEQNPVVYDLALDLAWRSTAPDLPLWMRGYVTARYGTDLPDAQRAWKLLLDSVYSQHSSSPAMESPIGARPALALDRASAWGDFVRDYDPGDVWSAWERLQASSATLSRVDTYRYDLVDVGRQALADLSVPVYGDVVAAYRSGDIRRFEAAKARFLDLIVDVDTLVGTRREFLLGRWLADARKWGTTTQERDLYERNGRLLLTVWGPPSGDAFLADYAGRQWSGLIRGFYLRRWEKFFAFLAAQPPGYSDDHLAKVMDRPGNDSSPFYRELADWEYRWCDEHGVFPSEPTGDPVLEAQRLLGKWSPVMREIYPRFKWKKPNPPPHS
jgi:alpha-N-acetylglucosaminidase